MEFVKKSSDGRMAEFVLDSSVYPKETVMKTAYLFLDKAYFRFANSPEGFLTACKTKSDSLSAETLLGEFANELLNTVLRERMAMENRAVRETIYAGALAHCFREPDELSCRPHQAPAFEKDLDQILKEIEGELGLANDAGTKAA